MRVSEAVKQNIVLVLSVVVSVCVSVRAKLLKTN